MQSSRSNRSFVSSEGGLSSRPPSGMSSRKNKYRVVAKTSDVDELLFGPATGSKPMTSNEKLKKQKPAWQKPPASPGSTGRSVSRSGGHTPGSDFFSSVPKQHVPDTPSSVTSLNSPWKRSPTPTSDRSHTKQRLRSKSYTGPKQAMEKCDSPKDSKNDYEFKRYKDKNRMVEHKDSYVDEMLFGKKVQESDFPAPWDKGRKSQQLLWAPSDSSHAMSPQPGTSRPPSAIDRPPSASKSRANSRPGSSLVNHKDSYVDEMLFGPKLQEPSFAAPWEKEDENKKPMILFDYSCPTGISRPVNRKPPTSVKPAWK
ncbi:unnamed protein product [Owenia fusiformis]|uniref:RBPJ-interacting and tubulin-associated protein 1 n=1 Tax=Owenia fusiformis TaxID=6347 RepID=A0A8J1YAS9_OWEFU|nr:unnamed protein product [Owenia fusiformis]